MSTLTSKMLLYVDARANGLKGRAAALAAGYSAAGADVVSARLNGDPRIQKAIAAAKRRASRAAEKEAGVEDEDEGKKPPKMKAKYTSSLDVLRDTYNNPKMADSVRIDAAKAALPFEHARLSDAGKKEKAKDRAREIARGGGKAGKPKFATKAPPPLRAIQGGKA